MQWYCGLWLFLLVCGLLHQSSHGSPASESCETEANTQKKGSNFIQRVAQGSDMDTEDSDADAPSVLSFFQATHNISNTLYAGVGKHISDEELRRKIHTIKQHSGRGGMEEEEYFHFMSYVRDHAPQKLLVWGLGYDSVLLDKLNAKGTTLFLEMNADWIANSDAKDLNYITYDDKLFKTTVSAWQEFLKQPHAANFPGATDKCWDTILVDSPLGYHPEDTGRGVPIYTAKLLAEKCAKQLPNEPGSQLAVFVHDSRRKAENEFTRAFLGRPIAQVGPKKLRQFSFRP